MRFYQIAIWNTDEKFNRTTRVEPKSMAKLGSQKWSYTSLTDNGVVLTSALDVYIDIKTYQLGEARTGSIVRLSGISLEDISQFTYLPNAEIEVYAGMLEGYLPLSHGTRPNLLMRGTIWWANGNWEGTNTTLDLITVPVIGLAPELLKSKLKNLVWKWDIGQKLSDSIRQTLAAAYGKGASNPNGYDIKIRVSDDLVAQKSAISGNAYFNLSDFAKAVNKITKADFPTIKPLVGEEYGGVDISVFDRTITVYDGTQPVSVWTPTNPKEILFQDLIGQPAWKQAARLVFKTPMRGDIAVGDWIKLPDFLNTPFVTSSGGGTQTTTDPLGLKEPSKLRTTFKGAFEVISVRHVGQFRQADAASWVTVIECDTVPPKKEVDPLEAATVPPGGTMGREPFKPPEAGGNPLQTSPPSPTDPLRTQVPILPDAIPPPDFSTGR